MVLRKFSSVIEHGYNELQSPLVIVDLLIVDSLVIVDRLSRPNVLPNLCSIILHQFCPKFLGSGERQG